MVKPSKKKVIFLDRDGVINKFPGRYKYVTSLKAFKLIPSSLVAIKKLTEAGFVIFIISNQAGVAKKLYSKATLDNITRKMLININKTGGRIKKVLYCTHLKEENCSCRKPKTGLIEKAFNSFQARIDRRNSYLIGDDVDHDIKLGKIVKLRTVLVLSGREKLNERESWNQQPDYIFKNLLQAADFIISS
jgi:D-glycero-D-manno-heptose 1,7-bisphosphate phosphatase